MDSCGITKYSRPISATIPTSVEFLLLPPSLEKEESDQTTAGPSHDEWHQPATGESFIPHEWVLAPDQAG